MNADYSSDHAKQRIQAKAARKTGLLFRHNRPGKGKTAAEISPADEQARHHSRAAGDWKDNTCKERGKAAPENNSQRLPIQRHTKKADMPRMQSSQKGNKNNTRGEKVCK